MFIVGLTGGIGSGKSTIAGFFRELGVPVYDSDAEAKSLMVSSEELREGIIQAFGEESYQGQSLNKNWLSQQVFGNDKALEKLNNLVHPAVRKHFLKWAEAQTIPLLFRKQPSFLKIRRKRITIQLYWFIPRKRYEFSVLSAGAVGPERK